MPKLIRASGAAFRDEEDAFVTIEDDAPDPGGDIIVSLARYLAGGESLVARPSGRLGVRLEPEDEVETLEGRLSGVDLVALAFPKFRDG
ncbi:MAG: oxidoreductase, partial [Phenylobacterium sp.]|nr:oxidoreductase [Phenylobacterium sp.]